MKTEMYDITAIFLYIYSLLVQKTLNKQKYTSCRFLSLYFLSDFNHSAGHTHTHTHLFFLQRSGSWDTAANRAMPSLLWTHMHAHIHTIQRCLHCNCRNTVFVCTIIPWISLLAIRACSFITAGAHPPPHALNRHPPRPLQKLQKAVFLSPHTQEKCALPQRD